LREYRNVLELLPEFPLTSEPMRLDLLVIKKLSGVVINHIRGRRVQSESTEVHEGRLGV
jgi:hypothetical protein